MKLHLATVARLSLAIWVGGGAFLAAVAAPAAFSAAGSPGEAARVVGEMLFRWHWISTLAPLLVLLSSRFRRRLPLALIIVAVVLANSQWMVDNRIQQIRASVEGSVSDLDRNDPVRRRFGALHGASMALLLGQLLCGAGVIATERTDART